MAGRSFSKLNVFCLTLPEQPVRPPFGLGEDAIAHSRGLITMDEVRAVTLHRLRLPKKGVLWDIGGGSGSVSVEAAAMSRKLTVYTVEHREDELANLKENIRRFSLFNIVPVDGRAAAETDALPDPDAVFIGGSDGEMEKIIAAAAARLPRGGRLVANGVTEKTLTATLTLMQKYGFTVTTSRITVERSGPEGSVSYNPFTIVAGEK